MPLAERRPMLRPIAIQTPSYISSEGSMRTPIPITPMFFNQPTAPMVMTPDTPSFDSALEGFSLKRERSSDSNIVEDDLEWTEDEDGLLQSARTNYPPGELPPSSALDQMTTQIMSSRSGRPSPSEADMGEVETLLDEAPDSWRHGWTATRRRLFDIARFESREAVGGHRRGSAEAIVPVRKGETRKFVRPKLVVLGGQGMNRQQHSMDSLFGDAEPPSISEAMRLSENLQDRALSGNSKELHSTIALESPLNFEFGQQKLPIPAPIRKPMPSFTPIPTRATLPRPSLLQRGHSYTGEDLARESAHSRNSSRSSIASDDFAIEIEEATILPVTKRAMQRSASSPTSAIGPKPVLGYTQKQSIAEAMESDPITPLTQTTFPHSAIGLGPFIPSNINGNALSMDSDDEDATPRKESSSITFKITSPSRSPRNGATSTAGETPTVEFARMGITEREPMVMPKFTSLSALSAIANGIAPSPPPGHTSTRRRPAPFERSVSDGSPTFGLSKSASHPVLSSPPARSASSPGPASVIPPTLAGLPANTAASSSGSTSTSSSATAPQSKRQRQLPDSRSGIFARTAAARQRLNPGLSVAVPSNGLLARAALGLGGGSSNVSDAAGGDGGLRSPFEPKTFRI